MRGCGREQVERSGGSLRVIWKATALRQGSRVRLGFTRNYQLERDLRCATARLSATITIKRTIASIEPNDYPAFRGEWL